MSIGYKIGHTEELYYLTFQVVGWVDIFTRKIYRDIVIESLRYCQTQKGLNLYAYVIMSNHIHLLAQSRDSNLSDFIRDFKRYTSSKIKEELFSGNESRREWMQMVFEYHAKQKKGQSFQLWTHENHAEVIYSPRFIEQKLDYIHSNPVVAGIVEKPEEYLYSSARNYAELDAVIDVIILSKKWKTVF